MRKHLQLNYFIGLKKHIEVTVVFFSVTEKVWESESASETEEPVKEVKKTAAVKSPAKVRSCSNLHRCLATTDL